MLISRRLAQVAILVSGALLAPDGAVPAPAAGAPLLVPRASPIATVVSEEPDGVVLRLETGSVDWVSSGGYLYPTVAGFGLLREEGRPALPVRRERVGVPRDAHPRLTILASESVTAPPGIVGPVQGWIPLLPGSADLMPFGALDPTVYGSNRSYPAAEPVQLGEIGALREQPFVELVITPILHTPASGASVLYRSMTVRLDFGVVPPRSLPPPDASFEDTYDAGLVNARQAREFRGGLSASIAGQESASRFAASTLAPLSVKYKLTINRDAVYRLSAAWISANAPDLLNYAPSKYRMDCLGQQVPITVIDANTDGTLNGTDYVEFFGQALTWDLLDPDDWDSGDYTDDLVYWLYADSGSVLRIPTRPSTPTSGYPIPLDFSHTVHHELDNRFLGQLPQDRVDHWYQDPILIAPTDTPTSQIYAVNTPGVSTDTATASIKVRLLGDNYLNNYHRSTIKLNGSTVSGPSDWDGFREFTHGVDDGPANFAQSLLNDGTPATTDITVSLPLGRTVGQTVIHRDTAFQNWIEITYGRKFRVDTDVNGDGTVTDDQMLLFSVPNQNTQVRVTGLSQNVVAIYEITKTVTGTPLASPVRLTGVQVSGAAAPFLGEFQFPLDATLPAGTKRRFAVATITAPTNTGDLVPAAVKADEPSNLRSPANGADWLVIANKTLLDQTPGSPWQNLVSRRGTVQGLRVSVVDVENIYDEFSYGISDPQGIRDFIAYAYQNWTRIDPSVPLRYVLLLGDGSFDYKNGDGNAQNPNLLSTYMRSVSQSSVLGYMSDESYFSAVSGSDALPDLYLGRWPVHSSSETNAVASKILSYETAAAGQPWQTDVVFVADDADLAFEAVQDMQISTYLGPPYTYHRTYEGLIKRSSPTWSGGCCPSQVAAETRDRIIRQFNGTVEPARDIGPGAAVLSYVGHGSWQNWGDNFSFITTASYLTDDVDVLSNGSKLPLILVADCLSGGFAVTSRPTSTDLSYAFGDDFLSTANKGAIGIVAPSHLTFSNGHSLVEDTFFGEAFGPKKTRNLGSLNVAIQLAFGAFSDIIALRGYTLIADPAVNLIVPAPRPPAAVAATAGNRQVTVSWTASPEAASYDVYQATAPGGPYVRVGSSVVSTSFVATSLVNCTPYYYAVTSVNAGGFEGPWSQFNTGCGSAGPCVTATPLDTSPPAAPTGLSATDNESGGAVRVQWAANPAGNEVNDYRVYWGTTPGVYTQLISAGAATSFLVTGLTNDVTYYFALSGSNCSRGEGPKSSPPVSVVPHRIEGIKPPNGIGDLRIFRAPDAGDNIDDARLQWTPPVSNIYGQPTTLSSQEIYSGTTPNFPVDAAHRLATVSGTTSSYIHENGYEDAPNHYYLIVAVDTSGNRSTARDELPQGIDQLAVMRSGGNLVFSWPAVTLDVDGHKTLISNYVLYGRSTPFRRSEIGPTLLIQNTIVGTSVVIPAPAGTRFHYSVIAVDNRGTLSPW